MVAACVRAALSRAADLLDLPGESLDDRLRALNRNLFAPLCRRRQIRLFPCSSCLPFGRTIRRRRTRHQLEPIPSPCLRQTAPKLRRPRTEVPLGIPRGTRVGELACPVAGTAAVGLGAAFDVGGCARAGVGDEGAACGGAGGGGDADAGEGGGAGAGAVEGGAGGEEGRGRGDCGG